jgi:hypothetical protein
MLTKVGKATGIASRTPSSRRKHQQCGCTVQEDKGDGAAIEAVLKDMQSAEHAPIVQHLVKELFHKRREQ